jgi:hypothetical protein
LLITPQPLKREKQVLDLETLELKKNDAYLNKEKSSLKLAPGPNPINNFLSKYSF